MDEIPQAIEYTKTALEVFKNYNKINLTNSIPFEEKLFIFFDLAELYALQKEFNNVLEVYHRLFTYYRKQNDMESLVDIVHYIADIYRKQK